MLCLLQALAASLDSSCPCFGYCRWSQTTPTPKAPYNDSSLTPLSSNTLDAIYHYRMLASLHQCHGLFGCDNPTQSDTCSAVLWILRYRTYWPLLSSSFATTIHIRGGPSRCHLEFSHTFGFLIAWFPALLPSSDPHLLAHFFCYPAAITRPPYHPFSQALAPPTLSLQCPHYIAQLH